MKTNMTTMEKIARTQKATNLTVPGLLMVATIAAGAVKGDAFASTAARTAMHDLYHQRLNTGEK